MNRTFHLRNTKGQAVVVRVQGGAVELTRRAEGTAEVAVLTGKAAALLTLLVAQPDRLVSEKQLKQMHDHAGISAKGRTEAASRTLRQCRKALGDSASIATLWNQGCRLECPVTELSLECPPMIVGHEAHAHGRTTLSPEDSELALYVSPHAGPMSKRTFWFQGFAYIHKGNWVRLCRFGNEDWLDMPVPKSKMLEFSVFAVAVGRSGFLPGSDAEPAVTADVFRRLTSDPGTLALAGPKNVARHFQASLGPKKVTSPRHGQRVTVGDAIVVKWEPRQVEMMVELRLHGRAIFYRRSANGWRIVLQHEGRYEVKVFHPKTPSRKSSVWVECVGRGV